MNKQLIKEASEVISGLLNALTESQSEAERLRQELKSLNSSVHREKLANELEKKSLLSYDELKKIKDNEYSESELENFEKLSAFDPTFLTEKYTVDVPQTDPSLYEAPADTRKESRANIFKDFLQFNNY